ncbi:tautomerase family protein [Methylocystis bryophila]|uniref:Tautomerase family protein n=1 Tax=Methylocystis bryophila TaxID=655015 RepID=A0A1W6MQC9_9HYPH|nr:tautomerase family protein [Methylocystis bryophila]ARN79803.1 tautomerase family protein [Methylocystis bryophila]BDV39686.1 tautomerase family protein [Methylocystis bryophila]
MPLVRIDVNKKASSELIRAVGQAVYGAMIEIAGVPLHDKFQIVTRHEADELIYPAEGYLGAAYSEQMIFIQVIWLGGRSVETKQGFYARVVDEIHKSQNIRKEDIVIVLLENGREDWSFGNGLMQYGPK